MTPRPLLPAVAKGALAGLLATVPMTIVMETWFRRLPRKQRSALGPRQVMRSATNDLGVDDDLPEPRFRAITLASHFAFGAACGGLFGALMHRGRRVTALHGIEFGLAVWSACYAGWLPAIGWHPPPTRETPSRNLLLAVSHIVWGTTLGLLVASDEDAS